jgi:CHAT domain-containing protein/tetratricopeptide (TPR) repeat protein
VRPGNAYRCPDPEVHAAFVAGSLSGAELMMMVNHLRDCEDCSQIVAAVAHVDREERVAISVQPSSAWPWWLGLAAAVLAGAVLLFVWRPWSIPRNDPIAILVAAAPSDGRLLEPRISGGFSWAPLRAKRRDGSEPLDAGQMKLVGAAGTVLEKTAKDPSSSARHAAALAHLLTARPGEAAALLTPLAATAADAGVWNDLAAAQYALAVQTEDPAHLASALAAADAALRLRPDFPEAVFNRALIIDRLGLRSQARAAWQRYLTIDRDSEWGREARRHLADLAPKSDFSTELSRDYARLTHDAAAAQALAYRYPQEARVWGESEILARWARCRKSGDETEAATHLYVARAFGDALARRSGERMLQAIVRAAERAGSGTSNDLAEAHLQFREAQRIYKENRPAEAEPMFTSAGKRFERAGSPAALLARYFAANTIYDQGRIAESHKRLLGLLSTSPPEFVAHRAQVRWQLALADASLGRWGEAIVSLDDSVRIFEQLGEKKYATSVREILAEVYDRIGDPETAWHHRLIALRELGRSDGPRLQLAIGSIARAASLDRDWPVTIAFLGLELEIARRDGNDVVTVETLLLRARVHEHIAQKDAARSDLVLATQMISRLRDRTLRERAEAERLALAGLLASSPAEAVVLLSRAIDFHRVRGRRMFLPDLLLAHGRALAAQGSGDRAASDFDDGIRELEQQRMSLDAGEARLGIISRGDELFEEAVSLAIDRGSPQRAFAYSEQARSQELLESIVSRHATTPAGEKTNAILIEYSALPTRLIIFVVDAGKVRAVQERMARSALAELVGRLDRSIAARDDVEFRLLASTLYDRLVAPVAAEISSGRPLVFIPDGTLSAVPFAALVDRDGKYLIERHSVAIAPSAAVFTRLVVPRTATRGGQRLLVIAGPPAGDGELEPLSAARRETDEIAAIYGRLANVAPKDADRAALEIRVAAAEVIHFVGHLVTRHGNRNTAIVASLLNGDAGLLDSRQIASMNLSHTRVVVLATCNSARGENLIGEGSISVARAFIAAGVPSVVATLWPIRDTEAADFFPRLHQHLAAGIAPVDALRAAQLECIQRRDIPISMWAAVQVHGS